MARPPRPVGTWGAINVTKQGAKRWRARTRYRDTDGVTREVARFAATKGSAERALLEALAARTAPNADMGRDIRIGVLVDRWLVGKRDEWAYSTRRRYAEVARLHVVPRIGQLRVSEVTVGGLEDLLGAIAADTGAPTARLARAVIGGALGVAVRYGALPTNPIRDVRPPRIERGEKVTMTLQQVKDLRAAAYARELPRDGVGRPVHPGVAVLIDVMLGTGARIGEVLALRWSDIAPGAVTIRATVTKDEAGRWVVGDHAKTEGSFRTLDLPLFAAQALADYRDTLPPTVDDLVFPSAAGTVRDPGNVRIVFRRLCRGVGIPDEVTPHAIRRTVATVLDAEMGIRAAADQLGHTSESTAERHYVKRARTGPVGAADILQSRIA